MRGMLDCMASVSVIGTLGVAAALIINGVLLFVMGGDFSQAAFNTSLGMMLIIPACFAFHSRARLAAYWRRQAGTDEAPMVCLLLYPNSSVVTVPTNLAHYIPGVPDMTKNPQPYTFSPAHPHVDPYEWKLNEGTKE